MREGRGFRTNKRALLVLYGDALALLAADAIEAGSTGASAAAGDGSFTDTAERVPALKLLDYAEVGEGGPQDPRGSWQVGCAACTRSKTLHLARVVAATAAPAAHLFSYQDYSCACCIYCQEA